MKYQPPYGSSNSDAPYVNATPGQKGSPVPAEAIEHPQREIIHVITQAGLEPKEHTLTQLSEAIQSLINKRIEEYFSSKTDESTNQLSPFFLGEFYYFRHPKVKEGFAPAQGSIIQSADVLYPEAWEYFQTVEGKQLCVTEEEWQAMTTKVYYTAVSTDDNREEVIQEFSFNGIGGAPFYVQDINAGTLRLPDIRGMYAEASGFDGLGVGGVHGDMVRNIWGEIGYVDRGCFTVAAGCFKGVPQTLDFVPILATSTGWYKRAVLDLSNSVPTGNANKPRAWGANACVYLGKPNITS